MSIPSLRSMLVAGLAAMLALGGCSHTPRTQASAPPRGAPVHKTKFSGDTMMGVLLDDPHTREVLSRYIPKVVASDQISLARGLTLKQLAGFGQAGISPQVLAAIEADLAKLH